MDKGNSVRVRVGLLVPSTNSTAEPDFHSVAPKSVTVHSHRLWLDGTVESSMDFMNSELGTGAKYLAAAHVDIVCMAGTTNSFYRGAGGSVEMEKEMSRASGGLPAVSSSPAITHALKYYGARRLSIATPYPDWSNERLREYLSRDGFEVLNIESDERVAEEGPRFMNDQDPAEIAEFAVSICHDDADAVVCPCSGWRALEAAREIEDRTGRPCITTNMATIWRALGGLRVTGLAKGYCRLLDEMPPLTVPLTR